MSAPIGVGDLEVSQSQPCGAREPISRAAPEAQPSAAFTPGPWTIDEDGGPILYDGMLRPVWNVHGGDFRNGRLVCSVEHFKEDDYPNANARLIAAAPDLLEALRAVQRAWGNEAEESAAMSLADAAIAKAEGRP